jgi:ubiquinone/menaquinone biosynthesis C-methylase UbiE
MKLNWAERWVVNNPFRVLEQGMEIRRLKKMHPLAPRGVILEIGCGRGAGAGLLLQAFQPARIHALDLDLRMLHQAKRYLTPEQQKKITLLAGDVTRLPLPAASVEAVFDFGVLHHALDWRAALMEIARVLKPGGPFYIEELYPALYQNFLTRHLLLHPEEDRFSGFELRQGLEEAGLPLKEALDVRGIGILGVALKSR